MTTTAPIILSIWLSWELLELLWRIDKSTDCLLWAAPVAGLACAAFGIFYF